MGASWKELVDLVQPSVEEVIMDKIRFNVFRAAISFMSMSPGRFQSSYMVEGDGGWRT